MKQCTSCGAVNAPEAPACVQCGSVNFVPMAGQPMQQAPMYQQPPMGGAPMYQPAPQPPKKSNTGLIVGICVGVVVLAIVAIVLVIVLGKKDKDDDDKDTTAVAVTTEDTDWGNDPILPGVDEDDPTTEDMGWDDPTTEDGGYSSGLTLEDYITDAVRAQFEEECRAQMQANPGVYSDISFDVTGNTLTYMFTFATNIPEDQAAAFRDAADVELKAGMDSVVDQLAASGIKDVTVCVIFYNNDKSEIYCGYFYGSN